MKRLPQLTLAFALLSVVFFLLLVFLRVPFAPYPLMSIQDALDLLTPLVLLPLYWVLFKAASKDAPKRSEEIAFIMLAGVWALGHGMHLAANSINNLIEGLAGRGEIDITSTSIFQLSYFFDEHLSHVIWHLGILGLAALLVYREWRRPAGVATAWWAAITAGILYGFTYFAIFLEGQTVLLGLPCALVFTLLALLRGRDKLADRPLLAFFFVTTLVGLLLLGGWGLYHGGFPQFSDVGLI